jgi:hypothetical protein
MKRGRSLFLSFLILGTMLFGEPAAGEGQKPRLAILPFLIERIDNPARGTVLCPLCGGVHKGGEVVPGSDLLLTHLAYDKFEALERFDMIPLEEAEKALSPPGKEELERKPVSAATEIGKELKADFVLMGFLFRFEERVGSSLGVEKPASVGYDLHLLRIRGGKIVWSGKFDETQRPLSDDILNLGSFLRRKAKWLSAVELANVGMEEMLKQFPPTKELEKAP